MNWPLLVFLAHLVGLVLGVGAATVKLALLLKCRVNTGFVPVYLDVARPITRQIILGQVLLTLSGIAYLLQGYPFTPRLIAKLILVAAIWVLGPLIDNVFEPRFRNLAPAPGQPVSPEFTTALNRYTAIEALATGVFWVIVLMWVLK